MKTVAQHQHDKRTAPSAGDAGVGGTVDLAWRKILRDFTCDRRDATPWETRVRFTGGTSGVFGLLPMPP